MNKRLRTRLGIGLMLLIGALTAAVRMTADAAEAPGDRWTAEELGVLASMRLSQLPPAPVDPSNAVESLPAAVAFGKRLFHDPRFSRNQAVSCASCHAPDRQFQDGLPLGRGVATGTRRSMPIVGAAHSPWLFWDGRKDSLWAQALGPLEDAAEHGGNRTRYVQLIREHYKLEYESVFGAMPAMPGLPSDAGPLGSPTEQAAWQAMAPATRDAVSRVFAGMGKAIAAYEKTLAYGTSRFDRYAQAAIDGDARSAQVLGAQEVRGLRLFIGKGQCVTCHNGPLLTDQHFHNTGVPQRDPLQPDLGRAAAIDTVQRDEFNCLGRFSDAKAEQCQELRFMVTDVAGLKAAFKTPSLRNVALRPPYMHAGQFARLEEVIGHYVEAPAAVVGHTELAHGGAGHSERTPIRLSEQEMKDLASFLSSLSGPIIEAVGR
ncbi:MAG: cytochrome c peroxidase [Burkholderiaceae bacterium]